MPNAKTPPAPRCQLCARKPVTVTRPGQLDDLRLCTRCALTILPGALADGLLPRGVPPESVRYLEQVLTSVITIALDLRKGPIPCDQHDRVPVFLPPASPIPDLYERGAEAGWAWAERSATRAELMRLVAYQKALDGPLTPLVIDVATLPTSGAQTLFEILRPRKPQPAPADEFWRAVLGEANFGKQRYGDFVCGFGKGALLFWEMHGRERRGQGDSGAPAEVVPA